MLDKVRGGSPEKKMGRRPKILCENLSLPRRKQFLQGNEREKGGIGVFLTAVVTSLYLGINKSLFFADRVFLFDWRAF